MKLSKIILTSAMLICLSALPVFAVSDMANQSGASNSRTENVNSAGELNGEKCKHCNHKDPIKALQSKKEKIQSMQKDGKITKEEAEERIRVIDDRIKRIQDFNKLTLKQKKELLKKSMKEKVDIKVKDGVLTRQKADEIIKKLNEGIEKWDGNGHPAFLK